MPVYYVSNQNSFYSSSVKVHTEHGTEFFFKHMKKMLCEIHDRFSVMMMISQKPETIHVVNSSCTIIDRGLSYCLHFCTVMGAQSERAEGKSTKLVGDVELQNGRGLTANLNTLWFSLEDVMKERNEK